MKSIFRNNPFNLIASYFFLNFLKYFLIGSLLFMGIMTMASFLSIINEEGVMNGFSQVFLFKSLIWLLPSMAASSFPFAFVMALMLSYSELELSGELKAALSCGFSPAFLFSHILFFSVFLSFFALILNSWLGPLGAFNSRRYVVKMFEKTTNVSFSDRTFETVSDFSFYADKISKSGRLDSVRIFKKDRENGSFFAISASSGTLRAENEGFALNLEKGSVSFFSSDNPDNYYAGTFGGYETFMAFSSSYLANRKKNLKEMTSFELAGILKRGEPESFAAARQIIFRFFLSFSPFAFFFCALSLSLFLKAKGRFWGFALSLACVFLYYGLLSACDAASAKKMELFPWLNFLPFALFLFSGFWGWRKAALE